MKTTRMVSTINLLKQIRSELHDDVDARVTEGLDEVIAILEGEVNSEERSALAKLALARLGEALKYLPFIKALFEDLM